MTYKTAYNKIIDAYFKDEIKPMDMNFCFCGTLADYIVEVERSNTWRGQYSQEEFLNMEAALMKGLEAQRSGFGSWNKYSHLPYSKDYEDRLFAGMCDALDVLKEIHRSRGENVDDETPFVKRELKAIV